MAAEKTAARDRPGSRIMLIEPNAAIASLLARALAQDGHAVATAGEARRGAAQARAIRAALVVADIRRGPAGPAAARRVAALASAPVLAMSAHGPTIHAFEDAGLPILRKPFAIEALLASVAEALRRAAPPAGRHLLSALSWVSASIL